MLKRESSVSTWYRWASRRLSIFRALADELKRCEAAW